MMAVYLWMDYLRAASMVQRSQLAAQTAVHLASHLKKGCLWAEMKVLRISMAN